jgi:hypothetical protein
LDLGTVVRDSKPRFLGDDDCADVQTGTTGIKSRSCGFPNQSKNKIPNEPGSRALHMPSLFICALIANAATFVLPISNPANLVI